MAHTCSFEWSTSSETAQRRRIQVDFSDEDWDRLMAYFEYAMELERTKLIREGGPGSLTINWKEGEGLSYSMDLPPDDDVHALLHNLRPFVLGSEATSFSRICNILGRRITDDGFRQFLKSLGHYFDGGHMRSIILIQSNDAILNSEEVLRDYLNAYQYHRDSAKRQRLQALHQIMPLESSRAIFLMMVYDKVTAIMVLANAIAVMSGSKVSFKCRLH